MKTKINNKLITRNAKISQYTLYAALATLVLGIYMTVSKPTAEDIIYAYIFLVPAYILVQISITMGNKWGRSPRPDEIVSASLKGLDNKYTLYIHELKVPHFLVGPAGLWVINTYHQGGDITFNKEKNRLVQKGGGSFFNKVFARDGIPNVQRDADILRSDIQKQMHESDLEQYPLINIIHVFFNEDIEIKTEDYPEVLIRADKLKDFIRRTAKRENLAEDEINKVNKALQS